MLLSTFVGAQHIVFVPHSPDKGTVISGRRSFEQHLMPVTVLGIKLPIQQMVRQGHVIRQAELVNLDTESYDPTGPPFL